MPCVARSPLGSMAWMLASAIALSACRGDDAPSPAPAPTSRPDAGPWRYADELKAAEPDVPHRTVLEVSRGDRGRAWVVAAVWRKDAPTLEVWTFEQRDEEVALAEPPRRVARPQPDADLLPAHDELRRNLATPGAVIERPLGRPAPDAAAFVTDLRALATKAADANADAPVRVAALADLVQGVDDVLVFEHDRLASVLVALRDPTAKIEPGDDASERRKRLTLRGDTDAWVLDVWAKGDGWVLAGLQPR